MGTLRTVTLATALVVGATSLTMAQNGPGGANGNNGMPPSSYQGPGAYPSYKSSEFQQGNRPANVTANSGNGMLPVAPRYGQRIGQRHLYAYQPSYECRRLRLEGRYLPRSCR